MQDSAQPTLPPLKKYLLTAWKIFEIIQRFIHFPIFGFTIMLILLGAASATLQLSTWQIIGLIANGIVFHLFLYILNDIIDLPVDRLRPQRAEELLVKGVIKPYQALIIVLIQIPLAFALTFFMKADSLAYIVLVILYGCGAIYNLWGKRNPFPPLTDFIQGISWGALVLFGALLVQKPPTFLTGIIIAFMVIYPLLLSGVYGTLRDVGSDLAAGATTTVILFGVRPHNAKGLSIPLKLIVYSFTWQIIMSTLVLWPLIINYFQYTPIVLISTLIILLIMQLLCIWLGWGMFFKWTKQLHTGIPLMAYLVISLTSLVVLFIPALNLKLLAVLLTIYFAPLIITGLMWAVAQKTSLP